MRLLVIWMAPYVLILLRRKTKNHMYIPLMPIAKEIFNKYIPQCKDLAEDKLFLFYLIIG